MWSLPTARAGRKRQKQVYGNLRKPQKVSEKDYSDDGRVAEFVWSDGKIVWRSRRFARQCGISFGRAVKPFGRVVKPSAELCVIN